VLRAAEDDYDNGGPLGALWNVALEQYHRRWLTSNDEPMPPPRAVLKEDRDEALRAAKAGERRVRTLPTAVEQSRELTEVRAEAPEWLAEWQRTRPGLEPLPLLNRGVEIAVLGQHQQARGPDFLPGGSEQLEALVRVQARAAYKAPEALGLVRVRGRT
jgi:hypothetical protein